MSVKKRKVNNSNIVSFESSNVRITEWAEHILKRLEDGIVNCHLDIGDKQLLLEETEAEVKTQQEKITEVINEGDSLIAGE